MSRRCELTGKGPMVGHKVSHSNRKTKRRFLPNLRNVTLISEALGRSVKLRVSANALRTVDHRGGLDAFLLPDALQFDLSMTSAAHFRPAGPRFRLLFGETAAGHAEAAGPPVPGNLFIPSSRRSSASRLTAPPSCRRRCG